MTKNRYVMKCEVEIMLNGNRKLSHPNPKTPELAILTDKKIQVSAGSVVDVWFSTQYHVDLESESRILCLYQLENGALPEAYIHGVEYVE